MVIIFAPLFTLMFIYRLIASAVYFALLFRLKTVLVIVYTKLNSNLKNKPDRAVNCKMFSSGLWEYSVLFYMKPGTLRLGVLLTHDSSANVTWTHPYITRRCNIVNGIHKGSYSLYVHPCRIQENSIKNNSYFVESRPLQWNQMY